MSVRAGPPMLPPLILLAAREEVFRRSLETVVKQAGYRVASAADVESTLLQARSRHPGDFRCGRQRRGATPLPGPPD